MTGIAWLRVVLFSRFFKPKYIRLIHCVWMPFWAAAREMLGICQSLGGNRSSLLSWLAGQSLTKSWSSKSLSSLFSSKYRHEIQRLNSKHLNINQIESFFWGSAEKFETKSDLRPHWEDLESQSDYICREFTTRYSVHQLECCPPPLTNTFHVFGNVLPCPVSSFVEFQYLGGGLSWV